MGTEFQCCSECSGSFYFYFNPDDYIKILLTFYDEVLLIAWPLPKSKYYPMWQSIISSFREEMDSAIRNLPCLSQGDRCSQRPCIRSTGLLSKFRKNEVMEAAPILHIAEVHKAWLTRSYNPHQPAFKPGAPTAMCICAGRLTCYVCGGMHLSPMTHGHTYSQHPAKWRYRSVPSFVLLARTPVLLIQFTD